MLGKYVVSEVLNKYICTFFFFSLEKELFKCCDTGKISSKSVF